MVELRHYEATNGWECSSGLLESVQRTANNQAKEPSAEDKYGAHTDTISKLKSVLCRQWNELV